jgi:hypothetical protein
LIFCSKWAFGPRDKRAQTATQIRKNKVKDYPHYLQVFQNDLRYVGPFIIDASSHEVGKFLAGLQFWSRLTWNVIPLEPFHSAIEWDRKAMQNLKTSTLLSLHIYENNNNNNLQIQWELDLVWLPLLLYLPLFICQLEYFYILFRD